MDDGYDTDADDEDGDNEAGGCLWSEWSEWTECTVTCGRGFIIRHRTAHNLSVCRKPYTVQQKSCPSHTACTLRTSVQSTL